MKLISSIAMPAWVAGLKVITSRCEMLPQIFGPAPSVRAQGRHQDARQLVLQLALFPISCGAGGLAALEAGNGAGGSGQRMPLGLNLISHGLLTMEQLKKATDEQKEVGGEIGELLVRQGSVSEKQVTAARATEWGCPVFAVPKHAFRIGINIPSTLMRIYSMIPVHYVVRTNLLLVGFVHSIEYGLLYAIEQITGCETRPCFVTPSDFRMQMQQQEKEQEQPGYNPARELRFESDSDPSGDSPYSVRFWRRDRGR